MPQKPSASPREIGSAIRIAAVGLGYWGPNLVRNLAESSDFELSYLCDVRPEALDVLSRRYPSPMRR